MEASNQVLALLLALAALIAATTEYAHVVRRRITIRGVSAVDPGTLRASGLPAMVRVFLVAES